MIKFPYKKSLWASHIYCFKDEKYSSKKDELITHVYDLKNQNKTSRITDIAKKNLFESKFDFFDSDLQAVQELKSFCEESLMIAVKDANEHDIDDDVMSRNEMK